MDSALHDKLAKILRLAGNEGATESERAAALSRAQEIAFKYNLSLDDVSLSTPDNRVGEEEVGGTFDQTWEHTLWTNLAQVNFCRVYFWDLSYARKNRLRVVLIGRPHNVEATKQMYYYLHPQMEREAMHEVTRRGQLPRYALKAVQEWARGHPQWFIEEDVPKVEVPGLGMYAYDVSAPEYQRVLTRSCLDLSSHLRGEYGLETIMELCGIARAYASEVRPFIKRGELAPEIVKDLKVWKQSFLFAMIARVYARLWEDRDRLAQAVGEYGQALVLREDQLAQDYYDNLDLKENESGPKRWDPRGLEAGLDAGNRVQIVQRDSLGHTQGELGA